MFEAVRWDDWSEEHIARHGVTPEEAEQVLFYRPQWVERRKNQVIAVFGRTFAGRYLAVLAADEGSRTAFVVTARDMTAKERRTCQRKAK